MLNKFKGLKKGKKLGVVALSIFILILLFGGCGSKDSNDDKVKELEQKIESLEKESEKSVEVVVPEEPKEEVVVPEKVEEPVEPKDTKQEVSEKPNKESVEKVEEEDKLSTSQKNAIRQADNYIKIMPFSKSGLIEQLEFEGYSNEEASVAVDNIDVDWKEQSVKQAKNYLDIMPYSRSGLIEQLIFEGYSQEDAEYATTQVGL